MRSWIRMQCLAALCSSIHPGMFGQRLRRLVHMPLPGLVFLPRVCVADTVGGQTVLLPYPMDKSIGRSVRFRCFHVDDLQPRIFPFSFCWHCLWRIDSAYSPGDVFAFFLTGRFANIPFCEKRISTKKIENTVCQKI